MPTFAVFAPTGATIIAPFTVLTGAETAIVSAITPILVSGLTINIMWRGYETMRGNGSTNAFLEVWALTLRVGLVITLGLTLYTTNVTGLIDQMIGWLSGLFSTSGAVTGGAEGSTVAATLGVLDTSMNNAFTAMGQIWDIANGNPPYTVDHISFNLTSPGTDADFSGILMILEGLIMVFAFCVYCAIAGFELLYINIALLIFYAIGPLFVASYAFKSTEHFFSSWLKGVVQYAMTAVVIAMTIGIGNGILSQYTTSIAANVSTVDIILLGLSSLASAIMLVLLIKRIPELAGHIVGGFQLQSATSTLKQAAQGVMQPFREAQQQAQQEKASERLETRHQEMMGALGGGGNQQMADRVGASISAGMGSSSGGGSPAGTGVVTGSRPVSPGMQRMLNPST